MELPHLSLLWETSHWSQHECHLLGPETWIYLHPISPPWTSSFSTAWEAHHWPTASWEKDILGNGAGWWCGKKNLRQWWNRTSNNNYFVQFFVYLHTTYCICQALWAVLSRHTASGLPHNNPTRRVTTPFPFYKQGNWGSGTSPNSLSYKGSNRVVLNSGPFQSMTLYILRMRNVLDSSASTLSLVTLSLVLINWKCLNKYFVVWHIDLFSPLKRGKQLL